MRHAIVWAAQSMEPDPNGAWVKYEDFAEVKVARDSLFNEFQTARAERNSAVAELHQVIHTKESVISRQDRLLRAARDRLKLLGHSHGCASRCSSITDEGQESTKSCNCGLDSWMRETGLG